MAMNHVSAFVVVVIITAVVVVAAAFLLQVPSTHFICLDVLLFTISFECVCNETDCVLLVWVNHSKNKLKGKKRNNSDDNDDNDEDNNTECEDLTIFIIVTQCVNF